MSEVVMDRGAGRGPDHRPRPGTDRRPHPAREPRFAALGRALVRRRRSVVVLALLLFVVAGALGADVATKLARGGFSDPGAESTEARDLLEDEFGTGDPNVVLLVTAVDGTVDDDAVVDAGQALTAELAAAPDLGSVISYWSAGSAPPLRADDASSALVLGRIDGDEDFVIERSGELVEEFTRDGDVIEVAVGGQAAVFREVGETIESDLARAELIALPITLVLLLLIFRSVPAALLPIAVGGFAIVGTFLVLEVLAGLTEVSIFALNLTTAMGLGLAIDYSLFVVSRYREERALGHDTGDAIVRTVSTAGRAVFFSGLTVAASLAALLVFPLSFLRSFAYAGIPVVGLAVVGAVVALPAGLALLGDRIDRWSLPTRSRVTVSGSFWDRVARAVMRRPIPVATVVVAFLLFLGSPFLHIAFGSPDDRVLPPSAESREVSDALRADYGSNEAAALGVVLPGAADVDDAAIDDYASRLSSLDGVARVDGPTGIWLAGAKVLDEAPGGERFRADAGRWLSVVPAVEPISDEGEALVADVRAEDAPGEVLVTGSAAELVDTRNSLFDRLPLAVAIVVGVIFVLLFLSFGSLVVPLKAVLLNLLSLTATFGAMVWIFQDGNLSGFFSFTPTGMLDTTTPILMFCVAFGLSMDYEVFLLSRIKEEYDRTGDNTEAVAAGLARTGRIITAAALLISVVFLAFATSDITFIKLFGIGLTLAVLMDATVVRATLVPAFMKLAGRANWWAPAPLRRIYDRFGMSESAAEAALVDLRDDIDGRDDDGRLTPPEPVTAGDRP
jgi:RND superfamily putative drug exporter